MSDSPTDPQPGGGPGPPGLAGSPAVPEPAVAPGPPPDPAPWGLTGAILLPTASFAAQLVLWILLTTFARFVLVMLEPNITLREGELDVAVLQVAIIPLAMAWSILTLGLLYQSVTRVGGIPLLQGLRVRRLPAGAAALAAGAGALMALAYILTASVFPPDEGKRLGGPLSRLAESGAIGYAMFMLLAVFVAPVVEEMLFRGYAYLGARRRLGPVRAGALVTVPFALLHLGEAGTYWPALAGIAVMAVLLVVIMEKTMNLSYCIAFHLGYNASLVLLGSLGGKAALLYP